LANDSVKYKKLTFARAVARVSDRMSWWLTEALIEDYCAAIQALLLLRDQEGAGGEKFRGRGGAVVEAPAQTQALWRTGAVGTIEMKIVYSTFSQLVDKLEWFVERCEKWRVKW
jgi:hypothetical protein